MVALLTLDATLPAAPDDRQHAPARRRTRRRKRIYAVVMATRVWPQTMLTVHDVPRSSEFYCAVLGLVSGHGGDEYEQLLSDGEIVLQLHHADVEDHHGPLGDADAPVGNGVLVWFEVPDATVVAERVRAAGAEIAADLHENPNAKQLEIWFHDPDGYTVVAAGPSEYRPR